MSVSEKESQLRPVVSELDININSQSQKSNFYLLYICLICITILVSALLVCVTIFYNAKLVIEKQDILIDLGKQTQVALVDLQANSQGAGVQKDDSAPVNLTERVDASFVGNKNATLVMYEFVDFQCPFCQKFFLETYPKIKEKYIDTNKIKIVFRHLPLPFHQNAQKAAEAAECAGRQGKFEEIHNLMFKNSQGDGSGLAVRDLKKYADTLGLNSGIFGLGKNKFNQCLDNNETAEVVKKDIEAAKSINANGTPTFVIGTKKIVGAQPFENFSKVIDEQLKQ